MEKDVREILAFALNFVLPGLGIHFSGFVHRLRWLQLVGLGLVALYSLFGVRCLASYNLYVLLSSYDFDVLASLSYLAVGFAIAFLGVGVERDISEVRC